MSTENTTPDVTPTVGPGAVEYDQYECVPLRDDVILYEVDTEDAWIQSAVSVDLAEMC